MGETGTYVNSSAIEETPSGTIRAALLVSTMASFLTPFMGSSLTIALPIIARELSMNAILLSWIATSYILAAAMFLLPFGKIADIYGRKRIFVAGILVYTLMSYLCGTSNSATMLIVTRVFQGIGGAMIFGTSVAILISVYPPKERGKALGINVASVYLGLSCGPIVGGFLTQHFGWRSIFFINIPFGLIILGFTFWKLRGEWAEARGERFDLGGSLIYSFSLVALMYGFSQLTSPVGIVSVIAGILGIFFFVRRESRFAYPLLNMNLFRVNMVFAFSNLAALINYMATSAVGFLLSLYLQYVRNLSPQDAGLVMISQPVVMAVFSPFAGRLSDRIEPRVVASLGMALTMVGLILLIPLQKDTALSFILVSLVLLGCGFALFSSPNTNAVMSSVEKRLYGVASATIGTMRLVGQMLSMGVVIVIFAILGFGSVQISPSYFPLLLASMKIAFIIFALLCFGGIFASLARGKVH